MYRWKRDQHQQEAVELEDEQTQTSSPGAGWQGRLSAFLHVHRGSRASSRKSSRASDASDLSELGGAWLNLPLLLVQPNLGPEGADADGADADEDAAVDVNITVSQPSPDPSFSTRMLTSPPLDPLFSRGESLADTVLSLCGIDPVSIMVTQPSPDQATAPAGPGPPASSARASQTATAAPAAPSSPASSVASTSPCDDGAASSSSAPSSSAFQRRQAFRRASVASDSAAINARASASSAGPAGRRRSPYRQASESTVVHVLVHRESEEYAADDKDR